MFGLKRKISKTKKRHGRWRYKFMLVGLLAPVLLTAGTTTVSLATGIVNGSHEQVVLAGPKDDNDKGNNKDNTGGGNSKKGNGKSSKKTGNSNDGNSKKNNKKGSNKSSSNSGDSQTSSAWNNALQTLAQSAASEDDSKTDNNKNTPSKHPGEEQATIDTAAGITKDSISGAESYGGKRAINAWGFMGPENDDLWESADQSSFSVSYNSLISGASQPLKRGKNTALVQREEAYKQAGRFAYTMQAAGLDQPLKSGMNNSHVSATQSLGGLAMQVSYAIMHAIDRLFDAVLKILSAINPINWALNGVGSYTHDGTGTYTTNKYFAPLADVVHKLYNGDGNGGGLTALGWAISGITLAGSLALASLGITVGISGNRVGGGKAIVNTFYNLLKRLFVWTVLPVFGLAVFSTVVHDAQGIFDTPDNSVANVSVFGSMVDYNDWVMNSRLNLPSDVTLQASFSQRKLPALTHSQIESINYNGAGLNTGALLNNSIASQIDVKLNNKDNEALNQSANSMLEDWKKGSSITASDYASAMDPGILANAKNDDSTSSDKGGGGDDQSSKSSSSSSSGGENAQTITSELVKEKYNDDSNLTVGGTSSGAPITGNAKHNQNTKLSTPGSPENQDNGGADNDGMSTTGMYTYLLTTAADDKMSIANTDKLSNDVALPQHRSTVLVGTGIEQTGNLVWAMGMMLGLAFMTIGYLIEVLKTIIESIPGLTAATFETALMSIRGGVRMISVLAGLTIGVFGSAIMYMIANKAFIAIAQMSDLFLGGDNGGSNILQGALAQLTSSGYNNVAQLGPGVSPQVANGTVNLFEGMFLLWAAYLLWRYRGIVVASLASSVEETANKIMATFGNLSGQGSSGTRGMIAQNANSNTSAGPLGGIAIRGAGVGMAAMGAGSLMKALGNKGADRHSAQRGADQKHNNDKNNKRDSDRMSQFGKYSSANRQGFAAQRTNTTSADRRANERQNENNNNAASTLSKNNDRSNLMKSANDHNNERNGNMRELGYRGAETRNMNGNNDARNMNGSRDSDVRNGQYQEENAPVDGRNDYGNRDYGNQDELDQNADSNVAWDSQYGTDSIGATEAEQLSPAQQAALDRQLGGQGTPNDLVQGPNGKTMTAEQSQQMQQRDLENSLLGNNGDRGNLNNSELRNNGINRNNSLAGTNRAHNMNAQNAMNHNATRAGENRNLGRNNLGQNGQNASFGRNATAASEMAKNNAGQAAGRDLGRGAAAHAGRATAAAEMAKNNTGSNLGRAGSAQARAGQNHAGRNSGVNLGQTHGQNAEANAAQALGARQAAGRDLGRGAAAHAGRATAAAEMAKNNTGSNLGRAGSAQARAGQNHAGRNSGVNLGQTHGQNAEANAAQALGARQAGNSMPARDTTSGMANANQYNSRGNTNLGNRNNSNRHGNVHQNSRAGNQLSNSQGNSRVSMGNQGLQLGGSTNNLGNQLGVAHAATNLNSVAGNSNNSMFNSVPVNNSITGAQVQSRMGDIAQANQSFQNANQLAQANPNNQTLARNAQEANQSLHSLQNGAMQQYSQQAVSQNSPQASWVSQGHLSGGRSPISVGTANNAMNSVYQAQTNLQQAQARYGTSSPQVSHAQAALHAARSHAIHAGIDSKVVNNTATVNSAHTMINEAASSIKAGTWTPQNAGSISHLQNPTSKGIGL